jgi:hypothetical protein
MFNFLKSTPKPSAQQSPPEYTRDQLNEFILKFCKVDFARILLQEKYFRPLTSAEKTEATCFTASFNSDPAIFQGGQMQLHEGADSYHAYFSKEVKGFVIKLFAAGIKNKENKVKSCTPLINAKKEVVKWEIILFKPQILQLVAILTALEKSSPKPSPLPSPPQPAASLFSAAAGAMPPFASAAAISPPFPSVSMPSRLTELNSVPKEQREIKTFYIRRYAAIAFQLIFEFQNKIVAENIQRIFVENGFLPEKCVLKQEDNSLVLSLSDEVTTTSHQPSLYFYSRSSCALNFTNPEQALFVWRSLGWDKMPEASRQFLRKSSTIEVLFDILNPVDIKTFLACTQYNPVIQTHNLSPQEKPLIDALRTLNHSSVITYMLSTGQNLCLNLKFIKNPATRDILVQLFHLKNIQARADHYNEDVLFLPLTPSRELVFSSSKDRDFFADLLNWTFIQEGDTTSVIRFPDTLCPRIGEYQSSPGQEIRSSCTGGIIIS